MTNVDELVFRKLRADLRKQRSMTRWFFFFFMLAFGALAWPEKEDSCESVSVVETDWDQWLK